MKRRYAVVGRTFGTEYFETSRDAWDFVNSLPKQMIEYDGEVQVCRMSEDGRIEKRMDV